MRVVSIIVALLLGPAVVRGAEPATVELRGTEWVEVNPAPAAAPTQEDPEVVAIARLVQDGRNTTAQKRLVAWFRQNRESPAYDRALFLMAQALYQSGNRIKAFYYLDQLLDEHPDSPLFFPALDLQYQIADAYLDGYKRRFLGIPMFHAHDEAIDMLYRIRQRTPGSPLAEKALLRTADFYYASGQYDLSADAYGWYAREYPRSPAIARVRLRQAFSNYAQFRGLRFDATPLIEARAQLAEVVALYPDVAEEERLPAVIERIERTFAAKMYETGEFYRRTREPRAAAYLYRLLIDTYPNTPEASQARLALERMPAMALEGIDPALPAADPPVPLSGIER